MFLHINPVLRMTLSPHVANGADLGQRR